MTSDRWSLQSPRTPGAVALIQLDGDIDAICRALDIKPVDVSAVRLRSIAGIDQGVVARWTPTCAHLMPHGGPAVVRAVIDALLRAGVAEASTASWPEAVDEIEARMLDALSRSPSPIAVDLLLDQPRRWRQPGAASDPDLDVILDRTLTPPLVVAIGASNIGKSSLINELAGRTVSIVADEQGTTRDHVGVDLDLAGLTIRCVDAPGRRAAPTAIDQEAAGLAAALIERADLLLACADHTAPPPATTRPAIRVALRTDLGPPAAPCDVDVCVRAATGLDDLARAIRDRLLPPEALADPRPWRFW